MLDVQCHTRALGRTDAEDRRSRRDPWEAYNIAKRLLAVAFAVPMLAVVVALACANPRPDPERFLPIPVLLLLGVGVSRVALRDEFIRIAPLRWLGLPSPPYDHEDRRNGFPYKLLLGLTYSLWLGVLIFEVLCLLRVVL